jgi:hypothetical protein
MTMQSTSGGDLGLAIPGGAQMSANQTTTETIRIVVDDVGPDGKVTLREMIEAIRGDIEINAPGAPIGKTSFDTAGGAADSGPAAMAGLLNVPITVVMLPSGAVEKVEGMAKILQTVTAGIPGASAGILSQGLTDDSLRNMFAEFSRFPDRPVKTGDTWDEQRDLNIPILGKMSITETYTLHSVENGIARVGITRKTNSPDAAIGPITMQIEYVSSDGELIFDLARGRTQRLTGTTVQNIKITVNAPQGGAPAGLTSMGPLTSTAKIELELLK